MIIKYILVFFILIINQLCFAQIENASNIDWKIELMNKSKNKFIIKFIGIPKVGSSFSIENDKSKNIVNGLLFAGYENKRSPKGFMKYKERNFVMTKNPYFNNPISKEKTLYISQPFEIQIEIKRIKSNKQLIWENQIHFQVNKINGFTTEYICYGFKIEKENECYIKSYLVYEGCESIWK